MAFYRKLFGCELEREVGGFLWQLRIGDSLLDVIRGERSGANMDHFCMRVADYDEQTLLEILSASGVEGQAAGDLYGAQGVGPSIYFADPDGNRVELKRSK